MGAGWVWLFLGLEPEKRSRNWQVPPPRWLACSEPRLVLDTSLGNSDPVGGSQQPRPKHCSRFRHKVCLRMKALWNTTFFMVVIWFVCVSSFYLGHHLNGLMDLHTKCCPIELFCMLNQASLVLKAFALARCCITCVLNHCGEVVTISEFYWI